MQKAKQASLFSPTEKPKDQVIKLLDTQAELAVGPISLSPDTLTSLGLNGRVQCSWKLYNIGGWRGDWASSWAWTNTLPKDLDSIPNVHLVASKHLLKLQFQEGPYPLLAFLGTARAGYGAIHAGKMPHPHKIYFEIQNINWVNNNYLINNCCIHIIYNTCIVLYTM